MERTAALENFTRDGYAVVRGLAPAALRTHMLEVAKAHLAAEIAPVEYEADVKYPGAPPSRDAPGGRTVRRLLQAYARDPAFAAWATSPAFHMSSKSSDTGRAWTAAIRTDPLMGSSPARSPDADPGDRAGRPRAG